MKKVRPTDKQKAVVRARLENPTASDMEIGRIAGYSESTIKNMRRDVLEKPGVKEFVEKLAPDDFIAERLNEGLSAYKRDQFSGELSPDFKERREYVDDVLSLKGYKQEGGTKIMVNVMPILGGQSKPD